MKKTLIALAVAASAAVSGSAMAWTQNGIGGSVDFSGTLNPKDLITPWEVKVGDGVNDLNALIKKGQSRVDVAVNKSILALGIRTTSNRAFLGQTGIAPQIDFKNAIDLNGFEGGVTTLTLDVKDSTSNDKIGTLTAPFNTGAVGSITGASNFANVYTYMSANSASGAARGFSGGLATDWGKINKAPQTVLNALSTEIMANFDAQGMSFAGSGLSSNFSTSGAKYSAAYGAGILANDTIKIALDNPVTGDAEIAWKAELPVTVSYQ
ncbi:hypothetical protein [Escherichia coli]|uniref:F4 family fimbrial subunit n=1 Tax=Escherichia coli TaxID=562 RepID=UPI000CFB91D1|nr:hypothetical protein [Escherichia coli]